MTARTPDGHLSPQQARVLTHIARGLSYTQTARAMGIHSGTVDNYAWKARTAMGATTTAHAIALAIAGGHLPANVANGSEVDR